jgi:hypothetical protein
LECLTKARALVDGSEAMRVKARVLNRAAVMALVAGDYSATIRFGREALAISEDRSVGASRYIREAEGLVAASA